MQNDKLVALIFPDFDEAFANGIKTADLGQLFESSRKELNSQLPAYSQISKIKIHYEEFEKTAKKSIKRFMYQNMKD
jgi:long-chain acyl-CoA synthetase